jgi:DNA-binding MarR family transcriptional regulator
MSAQSTPAYRFGDLLALARQSWVAQMAAGLASAGYLDYRPSDAAAIRLLRRGPMPVGRLGDGLGVTRQAARKVVAGLEARGLAAIGRDDRDARQLNVALTTDGEAYAHAVAAVVDQLNRALARRVSADQLAAADAVLRAALADDHGRTLAAYLPPPGRSAPSG